MRQSTFLLILTVLAGTHALAGRWAYDCQLPDSPHGKQVRTIELAVQSAGEGRDWYWLTGTKVNGEVYRVWFLVSGEPAGRRNGQDPVFHRYLLQEPGAEPLEYVDGYTGRALLPLFDFVEKLLPHPTNTGDRLGFESGRYLGLPIRLRESLSEEDISPPRDVEKLVLRTDLLVGTSRNFRDDGNGRASPEANYGFAEFTRPEYDEMIDAGINSFIVRGPQVDWVCRRAVFYEGWDPDLAFPEELYRSNFRGLRMYLDEPACRLAGKYPDGAPLSTAVDMIQEHIRGQLGSVGYHETLTRRGIDLGDLILAEPQVPIWETYIGTSFYQLQANPTGIVQECRWHLDPAYDSQMILMLQRINEEFDVDIPTTPANLFTWFYSQMRGPCRLLDARWGMSIYGQAEPALRWPSIKLAYDLGAEYVWFWTSDHDHHVTYPEQLRLARKLRDYAASRPKRDLQALRRTADIAVVLPWGYTLPTVWQLHTWGTHIYALDRTNDHGLTYRQVLVPAIREIERLLVTDTPYDVVPEVPRLEHAGYRRLIRIGEDGSVRKSNLQPCGF